MKKKIFLCAIILIGSGLFFLNAHAFTFTTPLPQACPVPGSCPTNEQAGSSIAAYIARIYQLAVALAGILAVGMIVGGAIYITISGDSPDRKNEGRDMILSAIWGLLLLLGSYIVLKTINPQLVNLQEPTLPQAPTSTYPLSQITNCPVPGDTSCFYDPSKPSSTAACDFQNTSAVCTAIDAVTPACSVLPFPQGVTGCICNGCSPLARAPANSFVTTPGSAIPIKSATCSGGITSSGLGTCFLNENTESKLQNFINNLLGQTSARQSSNFILGDVPNGWRVTEAFPPTVQHDSPCHYNGTCFDFAPDGGASDSPNFCNQLKLVTDTASRIFSKIYIEGLDRGYCPNIPINTWVGNVLRKTFVTTTGFHVHIQ